MTEKQTKYRNPKYREKCLSNAREYVRKADFVRRRRIFYSKRVYDIRDQIEALLEKVADKEKKLIYYVAKLEKYKAKVRESSPRKFKA